MTHSGFKTAQHNRNLQKKENNNKDYRDKPKGRYVFANMTLDMNYILRTKYGIYLNEKNRNYLMWDVEFEKRVAPGPIFFEEHTPEENDIINELLKTHPPMVSRDHTHTQHSKIKTKTRNNARKQKWDTIV
jgi:hypothetical protein